MATDDEQAVPLPPVVAPQTIWGIPVVETALVPPGEAWAIVGNYPPKPRDSRVVRVFRTSEQPDDPA
jgi:hypothetical protein